MDGRSFDALSRAVGARRSRREVVRGLAGVALGALLGRQVVEDVSAACTLTCPPPEQYLGAGCRCLCKVTGRPPVNGTCPCPAGHVRCGNGACVTQPVTITCPPNGVSTGASGFCGRHHNITPSITGPAGTTVNCNPASGSLFPPGVTPVTCTATAPNGCVESCGFTIEVFDVTDPSVTCPANILTGSNPVHCEAFVGYSVPTGTDNCPGATTTCTPPPGIFPLGTTTVTCTTTDASQNTDSCTFTVTIADAQSPTVTCPANVVVSNDPNQCGALVTFPTPEASDPCPGVGSVSCTPPSGSFFPVGTTTVSCTATDSGNNAGSCTFTVTVNDTQPPVLDLPASNQHIPADPNVCGKTLSFGVGVSDNCPGTTFDCTPPAIGSFFPIGSNAITCIATDASGNTSTDSFNVIIRDEEPPELSCTVAVTVNAADGRCEASVALPASASDCRLASLSCSPENNALFPIGQTTAVCTATDFAGNTSSCNILVTVNDPTGTCP